MGAVVSGVEAQPVREYPRKWFKLSKWGGHITSREFIKETPKMLFYLNDRGQESRETKSTEYGTWYATMAEAEAALAAVRDRDRRKAEARRVAAAAPDLLEALIAAEGLIPGTFAEGGTVHKQMQAAIRQARGEA